jgi:predicted FMN-binding regulatory protein PaiB
MQGTDRFAPRSPADVLRLVRENPLAWVVSRSGDGFIATPLPLRPVAGAQGNIERILGHFARSNAHVEALRQEPRAILLFLGPHGYISPSWMHDRTWGPTWNYAVAQFVVDIEFHEDPVLLEGVLRDLVGALEEGHENAWQIEELGPRYDQLSRHIVPFVAHIRAQRARFKLGQDERDAIFQDITATLRAHGDDELLRWTEEQNSWRAAR